MPVVVVANPKGGVGKSTVATQIAGYFASRGHAVMLGDVDRQQSSRTWLSIRHPGLPRIGSWDTTHDSIVRPPKGTTHVVLDTPAGLHGKRLDEVMKLADKVIVPLQPSIFDIHATHAFLKELLAHRRSDKVAMGIVGMGARRGENSVGQLRDFLGGVSVPVLGYLRDTQNYVHLAARGMTLWDVGGSRFERDLAQWQPIVDWLEQ